MNLYWMMTDGGGYFCLGRGYFKSNLSVHCTDLVLVQVHVLTRKPVILCKGVCMCMRLLEGRF